MSMLAIEGSVTYEWSTVDDAGYADAVKAWEGTVGKHTHWAETVGTDGIGDLVRTLDPEQELTLVHSRLVGG